MRKTLWGLGVFMAWGLAVADPLIDFSMVLPATPDQHVLVRPFVSWEVRPDAASHCEKVKDHDGYAVWREGCVHWSKLKPGCTIVTAERTSHSLMGRLFLLCLHAGDRS